MLVTPDLEDSPVLNFQPMTYEHMNTALISPCSLCVIKVEAVSMNNNHSAFQSRTQNGHPYPPRQRAAIQQMQGGGKDPIAPPVFVMLPSYIFTLVSQLIILHDLSQEVWEFRVIWSWRWRAGKGKRWCTLVTVTALTARDQMRRANTKHKEKTAQETGRQSHSSPLCFKKH